jgi:hypothetical protein
LNRYVENWAKIRRRPEFSRRKVFEVAGVEADAGFRKKQERGGENSPIAD